MQRLVKLPYRLSTVVFYRALNHDSNYSNTNVRMGLPFSFDENKALDYVNQWRKSFWYLCLHYIFCYFLSYFSSKRLAPGDWQQTPVTITRRYLPCWSFSLTGTVHAEAYVTKYFYLNYLKNSLFLLDKTWCMVMGWY